MTLTHRRRRDGYDFGFVGVLWLISTCFLTAVFGVALVTTPGDQLFLGDLHETYTAIGYRAWSVQFANQGCLADNPSALERRPPAFFNLVWFLFGRLMARGVPYGPALFVFRVAMAGLLALAIRLFMGQVLPDRNRARAATMLAYFGTGWGWAVALFDPGFFNLRLLTGDLVHGDAFPINTLWTFPHLALTHVLFLLIIWFMLRGVGESGTRPTIGAAGAALILGFVNPYHYVTITAVCGLWYVALQLKHGRSFSRRWANFGALILGMLPSVAYFRWLTTAAPNFSNWEASNTQRSWGFWPVALGYGFILLLALPGYLRIRPLRRLSDASLLAIIWPPVNLALHFGYPLIFFENRLGVGLIYPLSILSVNTWYDLLVPALRRMGSLVSRAAGVSQPSPARSTTRPPEADLRWAVILTVLCLPTTLFHLYNSFRELRGVPPLARIGNNVAMSVPRGEVEAMRFLAETARGFPLVLSGPESGVFLPAFAPVRTYLGQQTQIPDYSQRLELAARFFGSGDTAYRVVFLRARRFEYVWWSYYEDTFRGLRPPKAWLYVPSPSGPGPPVYPRPSEPYLERVFDNGLVTVYRVRREAL